MRFKVQCFKLLYARDSVCKSRMAGLCKECSYHTVEGKGNGMNLVAANHNRRLN